MWATLCARLTLLQLSKECCKEFGVTVADMASDNRKGDVSDVRRLYCYIMRNYTPEDVLDFTKSVKDALRCTGNEIYFKKSVTDYISKLNK